MAGQRRQHTPSKPVEDFNTVGVTFLGPSKTAQDENIEKKLR